MGFAGGIVTYLVIWWAVFFMVLPMRVKGLWEDESSYVKGAERGAPIDPQMWFKVKRTSWITAILWVIVVVVIKSGVISYEP
ncbi:DUF1467 family protein [Parvularcula sp. LCG005]|uniref:DUF1467 family protein n=1 Tax=Parvularcula sp. LCG005 TaxID=3078805 RepID=UPI002943747C|nr:DUF1467 family protein [Parvularcula sp. LCG005]WOI54543.1 DUF1467 family protein [Parvularcula sp. LCG005]